MRVAITGGTGLVGGHLATAFSASGDDVILIARGEDRRPWAREVLSLRRVQNVGASIGDSATLERAFRGCDYVAHCAGINREQGAQTYEAVHVQGTRNVVRAAEAAGVKRLALVSFLRARPGTGSPYHESKWAAEEIVRASRLEWTVVKPGMMFGRGDHLVDHMSRAIQTFPIYVGVGPRRVRPLAVEDAVRVLMGALQGGALIRKTVALVGPTQMYFDDIARLIASIVGKRRWILTAPIGFHYALAQVAEATMTVPLISKAQVKILEEEVIEPAMAPDMLPAELAPKTPFNRQTVEPAVPDRERFHLSDLRWFSRRDARKPAPTMCGEGSATIRRPCRDVLEFVLDVNQYRRADLKIGRVHWVRREGNSGFVRHDGRFMGLPAPPVTLSFLLTPYSRLDFRGVEMPWPLRGFDGFFMCEEAPEGTRVTHQECFRIAPMVAPVLRILFSGWLARDTAAEVERIKNLLEGFALEPVPDDDHSA